MALNISPYPPGCLIGQIGRWELCEIVQDKGLEIITAEQLEKVRKEIQAESAFMVSALSNINIK